MDKQEIYRQVDEFSYALEKIKHVSHILSEIMIDCEFRQLELASLAAITHEGISTIYSDLLKFIETLERDELT